MAQYQEGTVDVTNGSATVTGTGTSWLSEVEIGDAFTVVGDTVLYDISAVVSDTEITLTAPYGGTTQTGVSYAISRDFTDLGLVEMSQGDVNTSVIYTRTVRKIQELLQNVTAGDQWVDYPILTTPPDYQEGRVFYDQASHTLSYYNDEEDVTVNIGRELFIRVNNTSGVTLNNGEVVRIIGAQGDLPLVQKAQADTDLNSDVIGVVTHSIENNSIGYICVVGQVRNLDTSAFTAGDILYLSPTTAGGLTATKPSDPDYAVKVGVVERSQAQSGRILVSIGFETIDIGNIVGAGTAATEDVTTSSTDTTADRLTKVGDFGLGSRAITGVTNFDTVSNFTAIYSCSSTDTGIPSSPSFSGTLFHFARSSGRWTQVIYDYSNKRILTRHNDGTISPWEETWTTGNLEIMSSLTDTTADRLMPVGAFGNGNLVSYGGDIDDLNQVAAKYRLQSGATSSDAGVTLVVGDILEVYPWDQNTVFQVLYQRNPTRQFIRRRNTSLGTNWEPFRRIYNSETILGTVSQSSGVPTGAIIERGSNASGEYVKFADGTIDFYARGVPSLSGGNAQWTLPASISNAEYVVSGSVEANSSRSVTFANRGPSSVEFSVWDSAGARVATSSTLLFGHGRWF